MTTRHQGSRATIHRLLYTSRSVIPGDGPAARESARALAGSAAAANAALGLTGVLLFVGGTFIQVLEGPMEAVEAVFERICRDARHRDVKLVNVAAVAERMFSGWEMAFLAKEDGPARVSLAGDLDDIRFMVGVNAAEAMREMRALLEGG